MNDFEKFMMKHGAYWAVALCGVIIGKLYSKELQTTKTIVRSILASLVITFIIVERYATTTDQATLFALVFVAALLCDVIVEIIQAFGAKVKADPSILTNWWSKK